MFELVLPARYFVLFDGGKKPIDVYECLSYSEAMVLASQHTHPDTPFASQEAVIERSTHPEGKWGEHSSHRFINGKMVFPFT